MTITYKIKKCALGKAGINTENTELVKEMDVTHTGWEMVDGGLISVAMSPLSLLRDLGC